MIEENITELLHIYDQTIYLNHPFQHENVEIKGGAGQKILVAINMNDRNAETETLLLKMLSACNLNENDYSIIEIAEGNVLNSINHFQPETVLLFGLPLHSEAFQSFKEKNTPFHFAGKKFLLCDSLQVILNNPSLKSALWTNGLKRLFNL